MISIAFVINVAEMENTEVQQMDSTEQRDASNPLELPKALFEKYYRVNKPAFKYLLDVLTTNIRPNRKSFAVTPIVKLNAALRFFAEGVDTHPVIGKASDVSVCQSSLCKVLTDVINVFEEHLCPRWINFCRTEEEKYIYVKHGISSVIVCVDGTHVRIIAPSTNKHLYYNRKGFYSWNVILVCDHEQRIQYVDASHPDACRDSFFLEYQRIAMSSRTRIPKSRQQLLASLRRRIFSGALATDPS